MSFDTSGLSAHVKLLSFDIATKALRESKLVKALLSSGNYQAGVKTSAPILKMDTSVNFQAANCSGRNALGTVSLSDKQLHVSKVKDQKNLCMDDLYATYFSEAIAQKVTNPADETLNPEVLNGIIDRRLSKINLAIEDLMFNGDKSITGTTNLNQIDGIKKQVKAGAYINLSGATGATIVKKLQAVYKAMPVAERRSEDFYIFIGEDMFDEYTIEIANTVASMGTAESEKLFGTSAKLFPTPALNDSGEVYATRLSNLQLGQDGDTETEKYVMEFDSTLEQWKQDIYFSVGVAVIYPELVGYVKY